MTRRAAVPQAAARTPAGPALRPAPPVAFTGGGRPLDPGVRSEFEPRFGHDFSRVRTFDDPASARAVRARGAAAMTEGSRIAFAEPGMAAAPAGRRLLAHELAHVAQRQVPGVPVPAGQAEAEADAVAAGARAAPLSRAPEGILCQAAPTLDLTGLSNGDFLAAMYDAAAPGSSPGYRAAVERERQRRYALGHHWLTAGRTTTPLGFWRLRPENGPTAAERVGADALGQPLDTRAMPVVSDDQYQALVAGERARAAAAAPASLLQTPRRPTETLIRSPRGQATPYAIADPLTLPPELGGVTVPDPHGTVVSIADLNARQPGPGDPGISRRVMITFDGPEPTGVGYDQYTRSYNDRPVARFGEHGFVESAQGSGGVGQALFVARMRDALRTGTDRMRLDVSTDQRPVSPETAARLQAEARARGETRFQMPTAIEYFHRRLQAAAGLRVDHPAEANDHYYIDREHMAKVVLEWGADVTPAERALLGRIAAGDAAAAAEYRVLPAAEPDLVNLARDAALYRAAPGSGRGSRVAREFIGRAANPETPEFLLGQNGTFGTAGRQGLTGARTGALVGPFIDLTVTAAQGGDLGAAVRRAPTTAAYGAVGGGVTGITEQVLVQRASAALIARGVAPGLVAGLTIQGVRAVSAGVGSMAVEVIVILREDRPHSTRETTLRTARAGGIGALSGAAGTLAGSALSAAVIGGSAGTVAPGVGNAIGFVGGLVVGTVIYLMLDASVPRPAAD